MAHYLLRRLIQTIVVLVMVTVIVYGMIQFAPGGPSILLDPNMTQEDTQRMRGTLGLDQPLHIQYARWLKNLLKGDLGSSYVVGRPVLELVLQKFWATSVLALAAFLFAVGVGIPLGVLSAVKRYSLTDVSVSTISLFGLSVPVFWYGLMLIVIFSVKLRLLPAGGMYEIGTKLNLLEMVKHLVLPSFVLGSVNMALVARFTRSSFLSVMNMDYVRTARGKGLREGTVLYKHALRNALIPVVTIIGLILTRFLGGAAITETVFTWPGLGNLAVVSAYNRDYPVIMGITLVVSALAMLSNLLIDVLYTYIDPRIKYE